MCGGMPTVIKNQVAYLLKLLERRSASLFATYAQKKRKLKTSNELLLDALGAKRGLYELVF